MSTASPPSSPDPLNRPSMQTRLIDRVPPGWGDAILLLGRILIGGIFVQSGFDKLMGLDAFAAGLAARGLPAALIPVLAPIGASVEFLGGLAIVFGLMTRCAALAMIDAPHAVRVRVGRLLHLRQTGQAGSHRQPPLIAG
jgi:hypothetical protein